MRRLLTTLVVLGSVTPIAHAATAAENWDNFCAKCHGATGDGNTKEGRKLKVKDYTAPKVQAAFTDLGLLKDMMLGIEADAQQRMPRFKDKITIDEAKALVAYIRTLKKDTAH